MTERFAPRWEPLAQARISGELLDTAPPAAPDEWQVAPSPAELANRSVELIVPACDPALLAHAQCGAPVVVADFDDTFSPTWRNVLTGHRQVAMWRAESPVLMVRPRPWHLGEGRVTVDGRPVPGALFDTVLYLAHACERTGRLYLYLPKVESAAEAALWQEALAWMETELALAPGRLRVTVQIESVTAALQMDGITAALRPYVVGLNAGRWDYLFNCIKRLGDRPESILPDRDRVTMAVPFLKAYQVELARVAHRRAAQAIGGTAGVMPASPDDRAVMDRVQRDKAVEAELGYCGAWAAHPWLVPAVAAAFAGAPPDARDRLDAASAAELLAVHVPGAAPVSIGGVMENLTSALLYFAAWYSGRGAIVRNGVMEDTATAEVARAQLWQWVHHRVEVDDGEDLTQTRYNELADRAMEPLWSMSNIGKARGLLDRLVLAERCPEFFPVEACSDLEG